jgi:hypothetical protein
MTYEVLHLQDGTSYIVHIKESIMPVVNHTLSVIDVHSITTQVLEIRLNSSLSIYSIFIISSPQEFIFSDTNRTSPVMGNKLELVYFVLLSIHR